MAERHRIGVIGCGLIGRRRALVAAGDARSVVTVVADTDRGRAESLAVEVGARGVGDWREVVEDPSVDAVVVATPNGYLTEIGCAALAAGKHVLLEKPMGRSLAEANLLAEAAGWPAAEVLASGVSAEPVPAGGAAGVQTERQAAVGEPGGALSSSGRGPILKIGFNHRYHPALAGLLEGVRSGEIGRVIGVRGRYGHGGRPGCEREWRGDRELAGGGHLLDQGVHLADLIHGVAGMPARGVAFLQTAVWPLGSLEDNAYATFHFGDGVVAQFHVSMTQWKNLFSFEVFGEAGALLAEGLGGSYGEERLVRVRRRWEGGVPEVEEEVFPGPDLSWALEWDDFVTSLRTGVLRSGGVADGLAAMRMIDALYRSAASGAIEEV